MPVTAHQASLGSNPDMSEEKGMSYLDTIQGYLLPRVMCVLDLPMSPCNAFSVVETENNDIVSYPNPTSNVVAIESSELILGVSIYDVSGRLVREVSGNTTDRIEISLADLNAGLYSAIVRTNSGIFTEQVIKE